MAAQESPLRRELVRPAKRGKRAKGAPRRTVAGPRQALVGPRHLSPALDPAVPPPRRREIAPTSGYDAQAQKLPFAPYLRALLVRQIMGGSRHELPHGMAAAPLMRCRGPA
jgi:hypothetical protein